MSSKYAEFFLKNYDVLLECKKTKKATTTETEQMITFLSKSESYVYERVCIGGITYLKPQGEMYTPNVHQAFKEQFNLNSDFKTWAGKTFFTLSNEKGDIVWLYDVCSKQELPEYPYCNSCLKVRVVCRKILIEVRPNDATSSQQKPECSVYEYVISDYASGFALCCNFHEDGYHYEVKVYLGEVYALVYSNDDNTIRYGYDFKIHHLFFGDDIRIVNCDDVRIVNVDYSIGYQFIGLYKNKEFAAYYYSGEWQSIPEIINEPVVPFMIDKKIYLKGEHSLYSFTGMHIV